MTHRKGTRMNRPFTALAAAAAMACAAGGAQAQESPKEHTVFVGGIHIAVHVSGDPLSFNPPRTLPEDAGISVGNANTVLFGYIWRFRPQWSAELVLGIPPKHKAYGTGFIAPFGQVGSFRQVAPTAFLNYHFGPFGRFEPFVGAGINYIHFTRARSTVSGDLANGGPTKFELSNSWGPAAHIGTTFALDKGWSLLASVSYLRGRSDFTATTVQNDGSTSVASTRAKFGQVGTTVAMTYSF
jgi:outer membrane protein